MEVPNEVPNETTPEQPQEPKDLMGYEPEVFESKDNSNEDPAPTEEPKDITQVINDTLKTMKVDEKGKLVYPDNISPELKAAIAATKSFRDTQSGYTKAQQELKAIQAEAEALREQVTKYETPTAGLSQEEQTELNTLKYTDPDEWFKRMKALETTAAKKVDEKFAEVREKAKAQTVVEQREDAMAQFNQEVEQKLTKEMLEFDVPPRWVKEVEEGKLDFDEFLTRAHSFIFSNKVVKNVTPPETTNLNQVTGGDKDPQVAQGIDYSKVTF